MISIMEILTRFEINLPLVLDTIGIGLLFISIWIQIDPPDDENGEGGAMVEPS